MVVLVWLDPCPKEHLALPEEHLVSALARFVLLEHFVQLVYLDGNWFLSPDLYRPMIFGFGKSNPLPALHLGWAETHGLDMPIVLGPDMPIALGSDRHLAPGLG